MIQWENATATPFKREQLPQAVADVLTSHSHSATAMQIVPLVPILEAHGEDGCDSTRWQCEAWVIPNPVPGFDAVLRVQCVSNHPRYEDPEMIGAEFGMILAQMTGEIMEKALKDVR